MENCAIYSHSTDFDRVVQIIKSHLPKAKIELNDGGIQKSLSATIKGGLFSKKKTLTINCRQRKNPSYKLDNVECPLTQNLAGMAQFVQSLPAQNEEVKGKFLHMVMAANTEMAFIAEPSMTSEFGSLLSKVTNEMDAFVFASPSNFFKASASQHFLDKNLRLVLDTEGNCQVEDIDVKVDAKYHDQPSSSVSQEQLDRRTQTQQFLQGNAIKTNDNLPPSPSSLDTQIRVKEDIIERAYALLIMAVKGEGLEQEKLEQVVQSKQITSFSPLEQQVYQSDSLTDQERAYATWRYESLNCILWALGFIDKLSYPSEICDVPKVVQSLFHPSREEFIANAVLRPKETILDELDKIYCMNWACVDARIKNEQVSGNINPSVVYERHYALNWLTYHQGADWDDVQTNT